MKKINNWIKGLFIINTSIFIISFSIAFVILFRPFYYMQMKSLNLEKETGYTYQEIKEAYDDIIDYSILNKPFKTGKLKYSEEGKNHFKDCKILFIIDFILLGISSIILFIRKKYFKNQKIGKYHIDFYSSILIIIVFLSLLVTSFLLGFNKIFDIFHKILFPGKKNWLLDPEKDEMINILPKEYFMNCAILILSLIGIISIGIIIREMIRERRLEKN